MSRSFKANNNTGVKFKKEAKGHDYIKRSDSKVREIVKFQEMDEIEEFELDLNKDSKREGQPYYASFRGINKRKPSKGNREYHAKKEIEENGIDGRKDRISKRQITVRAERKIDKFKNKNNVLQRECWT